MAAKRLGLEITNPTYEKILSYNGIPGYTYGVILAQAELADHFGVSQKADL